MKRQDAENIKKTKTPYPCTLKQFLLLGQLGFIEIGTPREEIVERLGLPPNQHELENLEQEICWFYGSLVLGWDAKKALVDSIIIHVLYEGIRLPEPLTMLGYVPKLSTTIEEFCDYLEHESIAFEMPTIQSMLSLYALRIMPNISVVFGKYGSQVKINTIYHMNNDGK